MPELIRDSSHRNQISVLYMEREDIFRKISRDKAGRSLLLNELRGFQWYTKQQGPDFQITAQFWNSEMFTRLDLPKIQGRQAIYSQPITRNYHFLKLCLEHYYNVWPSNETVPCHGDLTLDNVIFSRQTKPVFFDWEHFSDEGECWGFDMAYLLLSAIVLPSPGKIKLNTREQALFLDVWNSLSSKGLLLELFENPVGYFKNIFTSKSHWQEIVSRSPNKLFPMWMTPEDEVYISTIIRQGS